MLLGMVPKHSRMAGSPAKLRRVLHITMVQGQGTQLQAGDLWAPAAGPGNRVGEACGLQQCPKKMSIPPLESRALGTQPLRGLRSRC